jgi:hypothetical protein
MSLPPLNFKSPDADGDEARTKVRFGFKQNPARDRYFKFALTHSLIYSNQVTTRGPFLTLPLGANFDPRGEVVLQG